jgi:hypothetical protein
VSLRLTRSHGGSERTSRFGSERAGITRATVTTTVVRGLIERDVAGGLTITKQGRAVLAALLMATWSGYERRADVRPNWRRRQAH